jgi:hypothetical protein
MFSPYRHDFIRAFESIFNQLPNITRFNHIHAVNDYDQLKYWIYLYSINVVELGPSTCVPTRVKIWWIGLGLGLGLVNKNMNIAKLAL